MKTTNIRAWATWQDTLEAVTRFVNCELKPDEVCESDAEWLESAARQVRHLLSIQADDDAERRRALDENLRGNLHCKRDK